MPAELPPPGMHQNNMFPLGLAVHHPSYATLTKYATGGCLVNTSRNWTKEEIDATVMKRPHESALSDNSVAHLAAEAKVKVASKWARLVLYDDIKCNIPPKMRVSPIAAIPHKSKACRLILDLSLLLKLTPQGRVPSVNEKSKKTAS